MDKRRFAAAHGEVLIDICWDCHGFWFDRLESAQLAPAAVVELFRLIHEHRDRPVRPLAGQMACPSCAGPLTLRTTCNEPIESTTSDAQGATGG